MTRRLLLCAILLSVFATPAVAEQSSRGDSWGVRASDNDYASHRQRLHKRMDNDRASSQNDRNSDSAWRPDDNENASVRRHSANNKKRAKKNAASNSAPTARTLND